MKVPKAKGSSSKEPSETGTVEVAADPIRVGSFFLETMTTGMYENPFDCVREYVQNGYDAIRGSIRLHDLRKDDGLIVISVEGTVRAPSLTIHDNGTGIEAKAAFSTLVSLGASTKTPSNDAGFRGIGRLAGLAYCTTLRFTTKAKDEDRATIVEFDCGLVRGFFAPGAEPVDVREVVRTSVRTETFAEELAAHYTKVEMIHLVNLGTEFVQTGKLQPYLRQVCPVDYAESFAFADRVRHLALSYGETLGPIKVEVRQKRERVAVHKPYRNAFPTAKKNSLSLLHNIEVFTSKEHGWFGWIGVSNYPGEIVDETAAGVRFRVKNIQIGGSDIIEGIAEELTSAGSERRLQRWAVGEIFIVNTQVVPNARRDGFEDSSAWRAIRRDVKEQVVKRIVKLIRGSSGGRSRFKKLNSVLTEATKKIAGTGITGADKTRLQNELKRQLEILATPDKLLGIDPKEISGLASRFKGQLEALAKLVAVESPDVSTAPNGSIQGPTTVGSRTEESATSTTREAPVTLLDVAIDVLCRECGDEEGMRLVDLIEAEWEAL